MIEKGSIQSSVSGEGVEYQNYTYYVPELCSPVIETVERSSGNLVSIFLKNGDFDLKWLVVIGKEVIWTCFIFVLYFLEKQKDMDINLAAFSKALFKNGYVIIKFGGYIIFVLSNPKIENIH